MDGSGRAKSLPLRFPFFPKIYQVGGICRPQAARNGVVRRLRVDSLLLRLRRLRRRRQLQQGQWRRLRLPQPPSQLLLLPQGLFPPAIVPAFRLVFLACRSLLLHRRHRRNSLLLDRRRLRRRRSALLHAAATAAAAVCPPHVLPQRAQAALPLPAPVAANSM